MRPTAFCAALVDVADEQVGAALVAEFPDLPQQLLDRDTGFFGPALGLSVLERIDVHPASAGLL